MNMHIVLFQPISKSTSILGVFALFVFKSRFKMPLTVISQNIAHKYPTWGNFFKFDINVHLKKELMRSLWP